MFPHSKFNDSESTSILRMLREQERMADKKLAYPLEKMEPSIRSNALPPIGAKAASSSTATKAPLLSHSTSQAPARKSQRKFSDDVMKYETRRECFGVDQNQNVRQRRDFDACLDDAVRKHEEDRLFTTKQRSLETSDDSRVRKRMERPKSAHYGRRRPQTSLGSYPERIDLSFNE